MHLERMLQINMALLAVMGALLLGMGQDAAGVRTVFGMPGSLLPLIVLVAAVSSILLTDIMQWFCLNAVISSLLAIGAVLLSMRPMMDTTGFTGLKLLIAMANLLIYLQVVLMYQRKDMQVYWQLFMLSLIQVIVSTVSNTGIFIGFLLTLYAFLALLALRLLLIFRETSRYRPVGKPASAQKPTTASGRAPVRKSKSRWPFPLRPTSFVASTSKDTLQRELRSGLLRRTLVMTCFTLFFAGIVFFATPRHGKGTRVLIFSKKEFLRQVGFKPEVKLGLTGPIEPSPKKVMRVSFYDNETDKSYPVNSTILLRGTVLTKYSDSVSVDGKTYKRWGQTNTQKDDFLSKRSDKLVKPTDHLIRQDITIERLDNEILFCIYPAFKTPQPTILERDKKRGSPTLFHGNYRHWFRPTDLTDNPLSFSLLTSGFSDGRQRSITPNFSYLHLDDLTQIPSNGLQGLISEANKLIGDSGLPVDDRVGRARLLEEFFFNPDNQFEYTLKGQKRNEQMDPTEDFIVKNRKGHCEYFASALVLMLRSQNIPARMIVGYKCDEWNSAGKYFQVRQEHAHAWVEVYLEPKHVPLDLSVGENSFLYGAWLRLDPGAASSAGLNSKTGGSGLVAGFRSLVDYAQLLWTTYIDKMDLANQQKIIYKPVAEMFSSVSEALFSGQRWRARLSRITGALGLDRDHWFSWRAALATLGLLLILGCIGYGAGVLVRRFSARRRSQQDPAHRPPAARVEFYVRLEQIMNQFGFQRPAGQTQHEFAVAAGGTLAESPKSRPLAHLPARVVDAFYQVRFGGRSLDDLESEVVEHALSDLKNALLTDERVKKSADRRP